MADPKPRRTTPARAKWILWGLLIACFVPRALMAMHLEVICADGAYFVELAQQIDRNQPTEAVSQYDSNLFPLILILLHDAGFNWEEGGMWWGLICGTLAVLPLFGWMRRQFDDRLAVVSCLLYAAHPKIIEWTPEIVREPTFWLLFTSTLYFTHRAFAELRFRWFILGGMTLFLAAATRFEGWFLLGAVALWGGYRLFALTEARWRWQLAAGVVGLLACFPVCMEGMARAYGYDHWPIGGQQRLRLVQEWMESMVAFAPSQDAAEPEPADNVTLVGLRKAGFSEPEQSAVSLAAFLQQTDQSHEPADEHPLVAPPQASLTELSSSDEDVQPSSTPIASAPITPPTDEVVAADSPPNEIQILSPERSTTKTAWAYAHTLERGFTPAFGILLAIGYLFHGRLQWRPDLIPMFLWSLATLAGMWIHLWAWQESSSRYATSIVILATPFASLGIYSLMRIVAIIARRSQPAEGQMSAAILSVLVLMFTIFGWTDALTSGYEGREARVDLGNWIASRYGEGSTMLGSHRWSQVNHYARGRYFTLPALDCSLEEIDKLVTRLEPKIIVLSATEMTAEQWQTVADHCAPLGFRRLDDDELPELCRRKIAVLSREAEVPRVVRVPDN